MYQFARSGGDWWIRRCIFGVGVGGVIRFERHNSRLTLQFLCETIGSFVSKDFYRGYKKDGVIQGNFFYLLYDLVRFEGGVLHCRVFFDLCNECICFLPVLIVTFEQTVQKRFVVLCLNIGFECFVR